MYRFVIVSILAFSSGAGAGGAAEPQAPTFERAEPGSSQPDAASRCAKAIPEYQLTLKSNPEDEVTRNRLGICYQQVNRLSEAIREYKQAVKLNPRYGEAWNNLASVYHGQKKFKDAVKHYRKAIEVKPDMAIAHRNLGVALFAMGRIDEGIAAFRSAFALEPAIFGSTSEASFAAPGATPAMQYYYFAKISAAGGRIDDALEYLRKARGLGFRGFGRIKADPDFRTLVADPRFAELTK